MGNTYAEERKKVISERFEYRDMRSGSTSSCSSSSLGGSSGTGSAGTGLPAPFSWVHACFVRHLKTYVPFQL